MALRSRVVEDEDKDDDDEGGLAMLGMALVVVMLLSSASQHWLSSESAETTRMLAGLVSFCGRLSVAYIDSVLRSYLRFVISS